MKEMKIYLITLLVLLLAACKDGNNQKNKELAQKKEEAEKLRNDLQKIESEISISDTLNGKKDNAKMVTVITVGAQDFNHYVELLGRVESENNSYISPRTGPGQVKKIFVKEGDYVNVGTPILELDQSFAKESVLTAQEQIRAAEQQTKVAEQGVTAAIIGLKTLKGNAEFAKIIYTRQKALWDQNIGSEVQLLSAKNNVETLENQLKGAEEQIQVAKQQVIAAKAQVQAGRQQSQIINEQLKATTVYSDVSGKIESIKLKVGETFSGIGMTGPQIEIFNNSKLKVVSNIPETYAARIKKGTTAIIEFKELGKNFTSTVNFVGSSINGATSSYVAESKIPTDDNIKPNQTAKIKYLDYSSSGAISIPVNVVQSDEAGKYVYVLAKGSTTNSIATKKQIILGQLNGENVEVRTGLAAGDILIVQGYQDLYNGQKVIAGN